jgi:hypothetical protein
VTTAARPRPSRIRFPLQPRLIPPDKAARRLGLPLADFSKDLPALLLAGFPVACSVTGNYDLVAIDAWLDRRAGLAPGSATTVDHDRVIRQRLEALG